MGMSRGELEKGNNKGIWLRYIEIFRVYKKLWVRKVSLDFKSLYFFFRDMGCILKIYYG